MKIIFNKVKFSYDQKKHFFYDASVDNGITAVIGVSGSGKSTLMNIICGLEKPDKGELVFNDRILFSSEKKINVPPQKRNIGVVFQNNNLFPHLSVRKNLFYSRKYCAGNKLISDADVIELLAIEDLLEKKPYQLSGGEQQRVAIGRTLLSHPDLILLDEPFSNLDKKRRKKIIATLLQINRHFKIPFLIISHDLEDVLRLTRSLIVVEDKKITAVDDFLPIAAKQVAPEIVKMRDFVNIINLSFIGFSESEKLCRFSLSGKEYGNIIKYFDAEMTDCELKGKNFSFSVLPASISIRKSLTDNISERNRLKGYVRDIFFQDNMAFLSVDCGFSLVAEITVSALKDLELTKGSAVFCFIKTTAIELVTIYE